MRIHLTFCPYCGKYYNATQPHRASRSHNPVFLSIDSTIRFSISTIVLLLNGLFDGGLIVSYLSARLHQGMEGRFGENRPHLQCKCMIEEA